MSVEINPPFRVFTDVDGEPLEDGYIHIGAVNQNPQAVPISVFWDQALTIPAAQPIRTLGGYPSRSGTPSRMYVAGDEYSISVSNKNSTLIYSDLNNRGGDAGLRQDLADAIDISKGAGLLGFYHRTVRDRLREQISIYDFFIPGQIDWTVAFSNAAAYLKGFPGIPPELVFPSGVFEYSESPNWAVQFGKITGSGTTRLRYTGVGDGVIIDGNDYPVMNGVFCMEMLGFIYEGPANSLNGFKLSATHHCDFGFRVDGCGIADAGIDVNFAVCTKFHRPEVSINSAGDGSVGAWYVGADMISAKPLYGMRLNQRGPGEQVAYCYIDNPIIEGTHIGVTGVAMLGTTIAKGTLEGCTSVGLSMGVGCLRNVIDHVDFEVNPDADIFCSGAANKFIDIDSDGDVIINAGEFNRITGGNFHNLTISAGATRTVVSEIVYNRANTGGVLTDNGVRTRKRDIQDAFDEYVHDAVAATVGVAVVAPTTTWVNITGNPVHFYVVGGVVTQITRARGAGAAQATGLTQGGTYLAAGDTIAVTLSDSTGLSFYYMTA